MLTSFFELNKRTMDCLPTVYSFVICVCAFSKNRRKLLSQNLQLKQHSAESPTDKSQMHDAGDFRMSHSETRKQKLKNFSKYILVYYYLDKVVDIQLAK